MGTSEAAIVPLPSCPFWLSPQHLTPPALVKAQLWLLPSASATTPSVNPDTGVGSRARSVVPLPSRPFALLPQHHAPPWLSVAHVCAAASGLQTTSPGTGTFPPNAHEEPPPPAMAVTLEGGPRTSTALS